MYQFLPVVVHQFWQLLDQDQFCHYRAICRNSVMNNGYVYRTCHTDLLIVYNLYIPIITAVFPETVHLHFFLFALFKLHILQFVPELFLDLRNSLHWWQWWDPNPHGMATPLQIRAPQPYSAGDDFALWIRRFEAHTRSVKIPDDKLSDALLALLDDAAFRAYDLLGWDESVVRDFKQLTEALSKRFAPSTEQPELRVLLRLRQQKAGEMLDNFTDALIHLADQSYPTLEPKLRMELARDRFVAGVCSEHVQEALLKTSPETLDHA